MQYIFMKKNHFPKIFKIVFPQLLSGRRGCSLEKVNQDMKRKMTLQGTERGSDDRKDK